MTRMLISCGALAALLTAGIAHAAVPDYDHIELQARSNLIVNDNGWNVPPGTAFNSNSGRINDAGQVVFTAGVVPIGGGLSDSGAGLWLGGHGAGEFVVVHEHPPGDSLMIDNTPSINTNGDVGYYTSAGIGSYVLRQYDAMTGTSGVVNTLPLTPTSIGNTRMLDDGRIAFKAGLASGSGLAIVGPTGGQLYATDVNASGTYAYIYSPDANNAGHIAVKVSTSDYSHNEIRLFRGMGDSILVAADRATDENSPFQKFDNGLSINDAGEIAVILNLADGNKRAVYRFSPTPDGYEATEIARVDAEGQVRALDSFAPAMAANGLVVFRGSDADGQAIFAGDGNGLVRVAGKGDVVETDLGTAQLGQHDSSPVFSGSPGVNAAGDIVFIAGVHPEGDNQIEWGTGVFVAYAARGDDGDVIFQDGFDSAIVHYVMDDGEGNTNQGPPRTFDPDMLWGNYFMVQPGGEVITHIQVAFGPTFPSLEDGPVTFWLLEDTDADGDPRNATAVASVQATPDVVNDTFFTVTIPPTRVEGAFFVGASAKLKGGADKPARVDRDAPGDDSWFFYNEDIAEVIDDLASAAFGSQNIAPTVPLPGAFMVRAAARGE